VDSTNIHTNNLISQSDIDPWTIVSADYQQLGRGQRGKSWISEPFQNLTFSVAFQPLISVVKQFDVSMNVMISLMEVLESYGLNPQLKWPNDVMVNGRKIAGILIENQVRSSRIDWSIVGIGLNVNQVEFPKFNWSATSIKNESSMHNELNRDRILLNIVDKMKDNWSLIQNDASFFHNRLNQMLFYREKEVCFVKSGEEFKGIIKRIDRDGRLVLHVDGQELPQVNGEIQFKQSAF
ncbi:MAG: biotin--[acetyl-CoA-carboxylase] ligase, partial [Salibacteraceae bacterium]